MNKKIQTNSRKRNEKVFLGSNTHNFQYYLLPFSSPLTANHWDSWSYLIENREYTEDF